MPRTDNERKLVCLAWPKCKGKITVLSENTTRGALIECECSNCGGIQVNDLDLLDEELITQQLIKRPALPESSTPPFSKGKSGSK